MSHSHQAPVMQGRLNLPICNMQSEQPLLIGSALASAGSEAGHYARQGDLTRHIKTAHGAPSRFLCHVDRCPRSIPGQGFPRKDKLVDHLKSSKPGHGLTHQDAVYQAAIHNVASVNPVPQATPLHASHRNAVQQLALPSTLSNDSIGETPLQGTIYDSVAHNPAFHNAVIGNDAYMGIPHTAVYGHVVDQGVLDTTFYGNAVEQATFNNIGDSSAEGQISFNSASTFETEDDLLWH